MRDDGTPHCEDEAQNRSDNQHAFVSWDLIDPSVPGRMLHIVYKPDASVSEPGGPLWTRARDGCARLRDSPFPKQALDSQNGTRSKRAFAFTATEPMLSLDFNFEAS